MNAATLRDELHDLRATDPGSPRIPQLFEAWFAQSCREGNPPDVLRRYSPVESERFWARTVPGPDGHTYWTAGESFRRNDGSYTRPLRWVWTQKHGRIDPTTDVWTTCGEPNCVTLAHLASGRVQRYPRGEREACLNRARVYALEHGDPPTRSTWEKLPLSAARPGYPQIVRLFGSWARFIKEAGLQQNISSRFQPVSPEKCIESLQRLTAHLGHVPSGEEYARNAGWLKDQGLVAGSSTIRRKLGGWETALRKAGL